jgi:hypothetical protein
MTGGSRRVVRLQRHQAKAVVRESLARAVTYHCEQTQRLDQTGGSQVGVALQSNECRGRGEGSGAESGELILPG